MQYAHHVLLISPTCHLVNDRLSGPLGGLWEAIPLPTALHGSVVTTTLWNPSYKSVVHWYMLHG